MSSGKKLKLKEQKQEEKLSSCVGLGMLCSEPGSSGAVCLRDPTLQLQPFLLPTLFGA